MTQVRQELEDVFPYKVVYCSGAEADDCIAVLAQDTPGPHMVITKDKDMVQLMKLDGVKVYSPSKESVVTPTREYTLNKQKVVENVSPELFLLEQIIRGDSGDSVPNILTDDKVFAEKRYQNSISKQFIDKAFQRYEFVKDYKDVCYDFDAETQKNFSRNQMMIDLEKIPTDVRENIHSAHKQAKMCDRRGLFDYCLKHQLRELVKNVGDF